MLEAGFHALGVIEMGTFQRKRAGGQCCKGMALLVAMIFLAIFSTLGVAVLNMSTANIQVANNHRQINRTLESALSGLEITRYWLNDLNVDGSDLEAVRDALRLRISNSGFTNVVVSPDDPFNPTALSVSSVAMNSQANLSFTSVITQIDSDTLLLGITGTNGNLSRHVNVNFDFAPTAGRMFDHGLATRGPLQMTGNVRIQVINSSSTNSVFIESLSNDEALEMTGTAQIQGDVSIVNPDAYVGIGSNCQIGGETGQNAVGNHVTFGADAVEFPTPDPTQFERFATNIVDSSVSTNGNRSFENIRIIASTDPVFNGNIDITGVVYIESPNHVVFSGSTIIIGVVVTEGDLDAPNSEDILDFSGNLNCQSVSQLPQGSQFDELREMTGTFILAPGFRVSFSGNFETMTGVIAASGITFGGNARGTITNSVINYSDSPLTITGNSDVIIDRSNSVSNPSGFGSSIELVFDPGSYSETHL